jgi:hypothetical protein
LGFPANCPASRISTFSWRAFSYFAKFFSQLASTKNQELPMVIHGWDSMDDLFPEKKPAPL